MSFFRTAKLFELVFEPGNFLVVLLCLGLILSATRFRRLGFALSSAVAAIFLLVTILPLQVWLTRPLENRFPPSGWPARVDGILVLGGGEEQAITASRGIPTENFGEAALVVAAELMRRYPGAQLVFSGGGVDDGVSEAAVAHGIFDQLGADQNRIRYEDRSRTTWENFLFSQRLVHPRPGDHWLLVTYAIHMPRSIGIARKLDWPMTPWPTNYLTTSGGRAFSPRVLSANLSQIELALHEWIGLVAYRWTGRSSQLFPHP